MTTKTQFMLKGSMGKPHHKPQTPSGGTGGYGNSRAIATDRQKPKNIGGGVASTYYANSRSMDGRTSQRNVSLGPATYTNFMITKKGKK